MKKNGIKRKAQKGPLFVVRAERALKRAARNIIAQHRALQLPVIIWQNGRVVEKPA